MSYLLCFIYTDAYLMALVLFHLLICEASVVHCHHRHTILFAIMHCCCIGYHLRNFGCNNHVLFNTIQCAYIPKALSYHSWDTRAGLIVPGCEGLLPWDALSIRIIHVFSVLPLNHPPPPTTKSLHTHLHIHPFHEFIDICRYLSFILLTEWTYTT